MLWEDSRKSNWQKKKNSTTYSSLENVEFGPLDSYKTLTINDKKMYKDFAHEFLLSWL